MWHTDNVTLLHLHAIVRQFTQVLQAPLKFSEVQHIVAARVREVRKAAISFLGLWKFTCCQLSLKLFVAWRLSVQTSWP